MLKELLFETRAGGWFLAQMERRFDLAVVRDSWLRDQQTDPVQAVESDTGPEVVTIWRQSPTEDSVPHAEAFDKASVGDGGAAC